MECLNPSDTEILVAFCSMLVTSKDVAQRRCGVCKGSGLVLRDKYYFRCPRCGMVGFFLGSPGKDSSRSNKVF
ncbi:hypothetical protein IFM89_019167, partial [Coptis chinensis]